MTCGDATRSEEFDELRPLLFAVAYRILGSVSEAEDAVQTMSARASGAAAARGDLLGEQGPERLQLQVVLRGEAQHHAELLGERPPVRPTRRATLLRCAGAAAATVPTPQAATGR